MNLNRDELFHELRDFIECRQLIGQYRIDALVETYMNTYGPVPVVHVDPFELELAVRKHCVPIPTPAPCPQWCGLPPSHPYDALDVLDQPKRVHRIVLDEQVFPEHYLVIEASEFAQHDGTVELLPPDVVIQLSADLTAAEARMAAAALLNAADKLDGLS